MRKHLLPIKSFSAKFFFPSLSVHRPMPWPSIGRRTRKDSKGMYWHFLQAGTRLRLPNLSFPNGWTIAFYRRTCRPYPACMSCDVPPQRRALTLSMSFYRRTGWPHPAYLSCDVPPQWRVITLSMSFYRKTRWPHPAYQSCDVPPQWRVITLSANNIGFDCCRMDSEYIYFLSSLKTITVVLCSIYFDRHHRYLTECFHPSYHLTS